MSSLEKLSKFHKTRVGHLVFGLVELALAYLVSFRALNNGSLIMWTLVMILVLGFIQNLIWAMRGTKK